MSELNTGTRRGTLQNVRALFDDPTKLAEFVGKDAELDCTLALFASVNPSLMAELGHYLDVTELIEDIKHINKDSLLRKARKDLLT